MKTPIADHELNELEGDPAASWAVLMQRWKQAERQFEIAAEICCRLPATSNEFRRTKLIEEAALKELSEIKKAIDDVINSSFKKRSPLDGSITIATIPTHNSPSMLATESTHVPAGMGPKQKRS